MRRGGHIESRRYAAGDTLLLHDGTRVEVLTRTGDETTILVRYTVSPHDPSLVGTEHRIAPSDASAFIPAPPGPEWGDKIVVVLHHMPESLETEEAYEAITISGVPLGATITASDRDTAHEALDRLLNVLRVFGYSGTVTVEDATNLGLPRRYEVTVGPAM